jgi:hypothetical protein
MAGAISILAALALSALGLSYLFERHAERRVVNELGVFLDRIFAGLDRNAAGNLVVSGAPYDPRFARPLSGLYWQVWADNAIIRSRSLWDAELEKPAAIPLDGSVAQFRLAGPGRTHLVAVGRDVTLSSCR